MKQFFATVLVAVVGFAAAPSFAQNTGGEVGYVPQVSASVSSLSREAVRAEYRQAQRNDALPQTGEGADIGAVASAPSALARSTVRAEAVYAVKHGLLPGGEV